MLNWLDQTIATLKSFGRTIKEKVAGSGKPESLGLEAIVGALPVSFGRLGARYRRHGAYTAPEGRTAQSVIDRNLEDLKHWPRVGLPRYGNFVPVIQAGPLKGLFMRRGRKPSKDYPDRTPGTRRNASNAQLAFVPPSKPGQLSGLGGKFDPVDVLEQESARREAQSERDLAACVLSRVAKHGHASLPKRLRIFHNSLQIEQRRAA